MLFPIGMTYAYLFLCADHYAMHKESEEEQSLKLDTGHSWGLRISDFIFLPMAYWGRWSVLSLAVSSHLPTYSVWLVYS